MKKLAIITLGSVATVALLPVAIVQGFIALRSDARVCREADAWMTQDFRQWAEELRTR